MQEHADALHSIHDQIDQRFSQAEDKRIRKQARFVRKAVNDAFSVGVRQASALEHRPAMTERRWEEPQEPSGHLPYLTPEFEERIYQRGFHDAQIQHLAERSRWQQERAMLERQRALSGQFSQNEMDTARQASFNQGYSNGHNAGYRIGIQAGEAKARATQPAQATKVTEAVRKSMIEKVLSECRVIGESNPQMEAGMNAVRHRIKKIKFE